MSSDNAKVFVPDTSMWSVNRSKVPPEEMLQYAGQWIAWKPDGTRILAIGNDMFAVMAQMQKDGLDPRDVMWEQVPPADEDCILPSLW